MQTDNSKVEEGKIMFWKGPNRDYWKKQDSSPREIFSSLKKEELIECIVGPIERLISDGQSRSPLRKIKKAALLSTIISVCESRRAHALCDRRGAIEHTKRMQAAGTLNASLPS